MSDRVRIAMAGCGGMAGAHRQGYQTLWEHGLREFEIMATCDIDEGRAVKMADDVAAFQGRRPTVGFFDTAAESGLLCGISVSMKEQGYAAGKIARGILGGRRPGDFPVRPTSNGRIQLNLVAAERLGIMIPYHIIRNAVVVVK